ncbi:unnamed protein product (macronuclear) [Paramecium tetraurelia]|uniref:Hexose transporter 1 n=1 Tax=Paramecium tetraurelia TaxID=5888 RepID=A0DAT0_PARTE|nr:uncharacterized protein GSPATT00015054001 [Paramecium tetraurelia]CAK80147.1 unnamed protein product [Paramecium tetraurelia]|eukprot:XP_001447544.1 hypothetical protein (macronuclear) [Paramecium tetraurelia strain d4-2]
MSKQDNTLFCDLLCKVLFITMGYLYIGYALTYYAITQDSIAYVLEFITSPNKSVIEGFINASLPIGAAVAALVSSMIVKRLNYRVTFILFDIIGICIGLLFTIQNLSVLILCRTLQGFLTGLNSALVIQYIYHFVPLNNVGIFVGLGPCLMMVGLTLGFAIQWIFIGQPASEYNVDQYYGYLGFNNWKMIFMFTAIPCVIRLFGMLSILRSDLPFEQVKNGNDEKAILQIQSSYPSTTTNEEIEELLLQIKQNMQEEDQSIKDLFSKSYKKSMILCMIFGVLQQFAGINAVNFYAGSIIGAMTNDNTTLINLANVTNGLVSITASIFSSIMINRAGRRIVLLIGNAFCFISLTFICVIISIQSSGENQEQYYQIFNLVFLVIYVISYSLSLGPVFWVYLSEVLPAKGISLVTFINWFSCAALAQIFPIIVEQLSLQFNFGIFAAVCLLLEAMFYFFFFETKGLTKNEIQSLFQSKKNYVDLKD